ncbi:CBASS cGAMP-activated phospholipase [Reyranella sp.]|uniref:CBASS cGAMP-activated phospholipase n=1 Tax=Reyranella sp. TaxID=1929291 RepID=UPI0027310AF1|nr:CBASS cGAMP-activated phospholipase [Reyranella sp.]MDP2372629.1 CBASS cGAMP-activated phospholipase [Reyranella sp.]
MSDTEPPAVQRSTGSLIERRKPLLWPRDRDFRILSIDGGGIKGIFPAAVLAGIETRFLGGKSIAQYFDLIAGTSTGGIIALGLGAGLSAQAALDLYLKYGGSIFPTRGGRFFGGLIRVLRQARQFATYAYEREPLEALLHEALRERLLGDSQHRLNIPAFEGRHSEVYIYKTPHHPDFISDAQQKMTTVALATSAAPTFFRALPNDGYVMVDGGLWANNPMMIALVDALSCFDVDRNRVSILSIGCGAEPFNVTHKLASGGIYHWRKVISAAMHLQSLNALGQARLLIGAERVLRLEPPMFTPPINLDDYMRSKALLPGAAKTTVEMFVEAIAEKFLYGKVDPYIPVMASNAVQS